jgi:aminopeptidase YwaD
VKHARPLAALAVFALTVSAAAAVMSRVPQRGAAETARIHEEVSRLAGPALRGRGSATADEAAAAAYVASLYQEIGLKPAPGMSGFLQSIPLVERRLGAVRLTVGGKPVAGAHLLAASGVAVTGKAAIVADPDAAIPDGDVLVYTGASDRLAAFAGKLDGSGAKLVIAAGNDASGGESDLAGKSWMALEDGPSHLSAIAFVTVPADAIAALTPGADVAFDAPVATAKATTTNAVGYLPGTDPTAGAILLSAHLDHLGVLADGTVMSGANDDASGTVAVVELARALAKAKPMQRGILFVAYGSEEIGGFGSTYFGRHPPVPLADLVANIEFEMIGAQDPKLPKGALMMTGSERSNLFEIMKSQGARIAADPYPQQNFFARSDNYSLALNGVVAHTFSGWAVVPTYHRPTDTVANLDIDFMARAIESLVAPIELLASGSVKPEWKPGGRPEPR